MANFYNPVISEETFAAWLDGALSSEQEAMFLDTCSHSEELQELLDANDQIEEDYENLVENGVVLPSEFESDFDIPQIIDTNNDEELYSYDQIEPYEQDEEDDLEGTNYHDDGCDYLSDIDNDTTSEEGIDNIDLL